MELTPEQQTEESIENCKIEFEGVTVEEVLQSCYELGERLWNDRKTHEESSAFYHAEGIIKALITEMQAIRAEQAAEIERLKKELVTENKDTERLDWCLKNEAYFEFFGCDRDYFYLWSIGKKGRLAHAASGKTKREAIDIAMKKEKEE